MSQLPEILRLLTHLRIDDEMPCFDPNDVIFVTNKWDTISKTESDSEEEDDEMITWKTLQSSLRKQWPTVNEKNIFKMSLKEVIHIHFLEYIIIYIYIFNSTLYLNIY